MITTFGHSTLGREAAVALLDSAGVDVLIDVRSHPTSRWEQWRREDLVQWVPALTGGSIRYEWWPSLGGWDVRHAADQSLREAMAGVGVDLAAYSRGAFPKQRIAHNLEAAAIDETPAWTNQGLYDYSWFTALEEYQAGLDQLLASYSDPAGQTCAIMCAEVLWWKCHRSMIADTIVARGVDAWHLQPRWVRHSEVLSNRLTRYPDTVLEVWSRRRSA